MISSTLVFRSAAILFLLTYAGLSQAQEFVLKEHADGSKCIATAR